MTSKIGLGFLLFELCLKVYSSSIVVYDSVDNDLCGRDVYLGRDVKAIQFNYYWTFTDRDCWAHIYIDEPYSAAYSLQNIEGRCDSMLIIYTRHRMEQFSFCGYYSTKERLVERGDPIEYIFVNHTSYIPSRDRFSLMIYAFLERDQPCSSGSYICTNGRCLHRDLYCNMEFSFCGDGSYQDCYNDVTSPTSPTSFGNIVGVLALVITLILVVIVVLYFCCCRRARRLRQSNNNNNNRPLTARDVYVIPTSQDNPDGEDYVIDYQKFAEPPAYETLEMTEISGASAHASAAEYIGTIRPNINNTESHHAAVGTTENNEPQIGTQANTDTSRIANEETIYSEISDVSESRHVPDNGNVNAGFSPDDEELPSYRDVLSDRGKFGVADT